MLCEPPELMGKELDDYSAYAFSMEMYAAELRERVNVLESAIRNLRDVKGRYHAQQACERLYSLVDTEPQKDYRLVASLTVDELNAATVGGIE